MKKTGFVSSQALVMSAAPADVASRNPTASQPRSRKRMHVDSNNLDPSIPIADDTLIDQRCPRFPRDIYVRMARAGTFPARKIGKRWVARYGDVQGAFAARGASPTPPPTPSASTGKSEIENSDKPDRLDSFRRKYGLRTRGG